MLGRTCITKQHICPVGIHVHKIHYIRKSRSKRIGAMFQVNVLSFILQCQFCVLNPCITIGISIIRTSLNYRIRPLTHRHQFRLQSHKLRSIRCTVFDAGLALLGLLRRNQNHTSCCTRTIDSCRSIFQKVDRLNIRRVDVTKSVCSFVCHSINDNQRIGSIGRYGTTKFHTPAFITRSR